MRKRLISIILTGVVALGLISCGNNTDSYSEIHKKCNESDNNYYNEEVTFQGTVLSSDLVRVLLAIDDNTEEVAYISKSKIDTEIDSTIKEGNKLTITSDSVQFVEADGCMDKCEHIAMIVISDIKINE